MVKPPPLKPQLLMLPLKELSQLPSQPRQARKPRKSQLEKTIQMMMILMLLQLWSHAAAVNAFAQMNSLRNLHAVDASQSSAVPLLLELSPFSLLPFSSFGISSFS